MLGVIDVGGGLRGIYGCGVFDYFLDNSIDFDYGIGVSAGSANIVSFAAKQYKRNYAYYIDYSFRSRYMSMGNLLKKRSYLDMDYIYSELYNHDGENPLDYPAVKASKMQIRVVSTSARTGKPVYFSKDDLKQDQYEIIKASCSIPIVNRPYPVYGEPCYDGGISDPIPFRKAFADGCDRVVVILTKPTETVKNSKMRRYASLLIRHEYPAAAKLVWNQAQLYRQQLDELRSLEAQGRALIIAPQTIYGARTLTKDKSILQRLYDDGYRQAESIRQFL